MRVLVNLFILITATFMAFASYAQPNKRQAILISRVGDNYFAYGEYEHAIRYYKVAFNEYPEYVEAQFQMAQCFRLMEQYDSAAHHYNLIISNGQDFRYPLSRYHMAMLQLQNGQKAAALDNLKAFRNLLVENEQHELARFSDYYEQAKVEIDKIN
ncbi:tetratricopeptide repeat protein [Ekhidna sp.]|uniref:tetratricopeptide repeat protein n=1 Tax=Ekhidna sp. TaxID=2608089 RepID=UPI003B508D54